MRRALLLLVACSAKPTASPVLDGFESLVTWRASASDGVTSAIAQVPGTRGQAMELRFDLSHTAGYAVARRPIALDLSGNFELSFDLRGDVPVNNLELKLLDASGENVWWYHRANYEFPKAWRHVSVKRRNIEFAWGPIADHALGKIAAIELVVSTGRGGGKGAIAIDELALRPLPAEPATPSPVRAIATTDARAILDGDPRTSWRGREVTLDLGMERDFGGLLVWWGTPFAPSYQVSLSRDQRQWSAPAVIAGDGQLDPIALPEASARYVRITMPAEAALAEVALVTPAAPTLEGFVTELGKRLPRGSLPRGFTGEQPYWTVVGVDGGGAHASLISEDGALELASGASVEPFVEVDGKPTTWADPQISQALVDGYLPIPTVTWRAAGWQLAVTALATGEAAAPQLAARYTLRNTGSAPLTARLVLAVRPYQVNPPTQFLNINGGVRKIHQLAWQDSTLLLDGAPALRADHAPDAIGLWGAAAVGYPVKALSDARAPVNDAAGLASGALGFAITLAPNEEKSIVITAPLAGTAFPAAPFEALLSEARTSWHAKLDRVGFRVPASAQHVIDTLRSSLAYMLVSRDGPILRPGTRSYARAWIRDGAMISEALLRLGHPDVARAFLAWYAPFQFASGKVPCCVEANGAVPVPENDSHGELIYLAAELARYTHDRDALAAIWPRVRDAARYLEQLRQSERTPANQGTPKYGLLPPTISHEGYSARPAYAYWDDLWGLVGYRDALWIARQLDAPEGVALAAQYAEFARDVAASVEASLAAHKIDYIPGAAELGDFDATSTTIALAPGNADWLPRARLEATFARQLARLDERTGTSWNDYTPYELRLIGSVVRLGWRAKVAGLLELYFADQRPAAWNQWAEVVGRELRAPRFIGDMPHAWVHSDYARSVLDMFLHQRGDDWVVAAGVPPAWFSGRGFAVDRLPTPFGPLSYAVTATERAITIRIDAGAMPDGKLILPLPDPEPSLVVRVNGTPVATASEIVVPQRPATIVIAKEP